MTPAVIRFDVQGFHRLIPARYSDGESVFKELADSASMLQDLLLLDGATDASVEGEQRGRSGISTYELVYGIPNAHVVNGAFTHTSDAGARFNDHTRGAWYAADELETSLAEVAYHKGRRLAAMVVPGLPEQRPDEETSIYDDWLADFRATFHRLYPPKQFTAYLQPEPVPECYAASQLFARTLLNIKSNGIVYPSVRRKGFHCLACFRPALVFNPRRGKRFEIQFKATLSGYRHKRVAISAGR